HRQLSVLGCLPRLDASAVARASALLDGGAHGQFASGCVHRGPICAKHAAAIFVGMPRPNVMIVVVDGLRASALGAYGNTTYPTPAFDHFAAESLLFDWCYAPTSAVDGVYQSMWQSRHPARAANGTESADEAAIASRALPAAFGQAGYATTL